MPDRAHDRVDDRQLAIPKVGGNGGDRGVISTPGPVAAASAGAVGSTGSAGSVGPADAAAMSAAPISPLE